MKSWNRIKKLDHQVFGQRFKTPEQCLEYLAAEKWADGFICKKCGHPHYCSGKTPYSRRCTRCKSEESARSHTIFHGCKIDLPEAFTILYTVCNNPDVSSYKLSEQHDMRQMTCWKFKRKIEQCMKDHSIDILQDVSIKNTNQKK